MKKISAFLLSCIVCVLLLAMFISCAANSVAVNTDSDSIKTRNTSTSPPPMRLFPSIANAVDAMGDKHGEWEELGTSTTEVGTYTNGIKTGEWKRYRVNEGASSAPDRVTNYNSVGEKNGTTTLYFSEESLRAYPKIERNYMNGKLHGTSTSYFDSTHIQSQQEYANGVKNGEHEGFIFLRSSDESKPEHILIAQGEYTNDKKTGEWYELLNSDDEPPILRAYADSGSYNINGDRHGEWLREDITRPSGKQCIIITYNEGEMTSERNCD